MRLTWSVGPKAARFLGICLLLSAAACTSNSATGGTGGAGDGGTGGKGAGGRVDGGSGGATSGMGGHQGTGGAMGTGGDTGTGGAGGMPFALKCQLGQYMPTGAVVATMPTISDFTYTPGDRTGAFAFGNYYDAPSGYGFHYPDRDLSQCGGAGGGAGDGGAGGVTGAADGGIGGADGGHPDAASAAGGVSGTGGTGADGAADAAGSCAAPGLTEDLTGSNWHIVGRVASPAAFAVGTACGIDASSFLGIEFTIKGTAGSPSQLRVEVGFQEDSQGSHDPANPLFGTCDFSCVSPSATVPVTATETRIRLPWSMFHGGLPMDSVNPKAIINSINWQFLGGSGSNAYDVDVTLDNLRFMTADSADGGVDSADGGTDSADGRTD